MSTEETTTANQKNNYAFEIRFVDDNVWVSDMLFVYEGSVQTLFSFCLF